MTKFYFAFCGLIFSYGVAVAQAPNISYPSNQTFTIGTAITPVIPVNSGGSVPASGYSEPFILGAGFNFPCGVAVDAAKNIYVADRGNGTLKKIPFGGGATVTIASGFSGLFGVAVDGAGNIYVSDNTSNIVEKVPVGGGAPTIISSGFSNPDGVAVDAVGNVYVADPTSSVIQMIPAGGGAKVAIGSGFASPVVVAVDAAKNIYVAEGNVGIVKKIPAAGGNPVIVGSGFNQPAGIAVDAAGNIFITESNGNTLKMIPAGGGATTVIGAGFTVPYGVAVDSAGNLYVADGGNSVVKELIPTGYYINPALPAGLSFDTPTGTISGTPTAVSLATSYTVSAWNASGTSSSTFTIAVYFPQNITFNAIPLITYGAADISPGAIASSGLAVNYASSDASVAAIVNGKIHIIGAGTATITASQAGDNINYAAAPNVTQTLTVLPAPLTITANNAKKLAGAANPAFRLTYNGFVNSETQAVLTSAPVIATTATVSSPPGSYPITVSGAAAKNYTISYVQGLLNVVGPPPAISYATPQTYTAGATITALSPSNTGGPVPATVYGKVTTFAGSGSPGNLNGNGPAATFTYPSGMAADESGNIYVTDVTANIVREITPAGVVTTFAGNGNQASVDGAGTAASFNYPSSIAIDGVGNLYVTDENSNKIRKITPAGVVSTYAGTGASGSSNGAALTQASFWLPHGIAVDGAGNVYVSERGNNLVRKITPGGIVSTLAGSGAAGSSNGTGTAASFNAITGLASDNNSNIYVADGGNNMLRKISPAGVVSTLAGSTTAGSSDGTGTSAGFSAPAGIAVDFAGNLYVSDQRNNTIRQVNPSGLVTTLAGKGYVDTTNAVGNLAGFTNPQGLTIDLSGNVYVADAGNYKIRKITATGFSINPSLSPGLTFDNTTGIVSGTPNAAASSVTYKITAYNTGGSSTANLVITVAAEALPKISYSTPQNFTVGTTITPVAPVNTGGSIQSALYLSTSPFAGGSQVPGANGVGTTANFSSSFSLGADAAGNVYVADTYNNSIRKITPSGLTTTIAGTGQQGANNGAGSQATFYNPYGVAVDASGNIYVADRGNFLIRKITPGGAVSTLAGSGVSGNVDATGTAASFRNPQDVVVDKSGNVFVLDGTGIRQVSPAGVVTTVVANAFTNAINFAIDGSGNFYVADYSGSLVKKVTGAGVATTIGSPNSFLRPYGIAVDNSGNIYVSDISVTLYNSANITRITRVNTDGTLTPLVVGYGGSLALDKSGNLYSRPNNSLGLISRTITANYYTISPSVPAGMAFNSSTGVISGTPAAVSAAAAYTVTAHNSAGAGTASISIAVAKAAAPIISYSAGPLKLTKGMAITPVVPTNTGGAVPAIAYGQTSTLAGNGTAGFVNGTGLSASFNGPYGLVVDAFGNLFVSDMYNSVIRKITPAGLVSTYAGNGIANSVDGISASASFSGPSGLAIDGTGNLFVRDGYLREITNSGFVTTPSTVNASGGSPSRDVLFNKSGNLVESYYNQIRTVNFITGQATVLAGSVTLKSGFKNGQDTAARFYDPKALAFDGSGNIYVADDFNNQIRKISTTNLVTTFAGNTTPGAANGTGAAASFYNPTALVFDASYNLYVADVANNMIRKITPAGVVTTLAGSPTQGSADGIGAAASFWGPLGLTIDGSGNLYVADGNNNTIRKVATTGYTINPALPSGLVFDSATGIISGTPDSTYSNGSFTVTAYNIGGSSSTTITIGVQQTQTITFNPLPATTTNAADFDPGATASSGLPVTYTSSNTAVATIVNGFIHVVGVGTSTITASQAGNSTFLSVKTTRILTVTSPKTQTITFAAIAAQTYGNADFAPGATASSGLLVIYSSSDTTRAAIVNNKVHIVGAGTVTITASQAGNGTYARAANVSKPLVIGKAAQTITFSALPNQNYNNPDFAATATATSNLPITLTSADTTIAKIVNGLVHIVSAGTVNITASQGGNNNYSAAVPVTQALTVNKINQSISFSAVPAKSYGIADFSPGASSTSGQPITYTSSDTTVAKILAGMIHITGVGTTTITASQPGNLNYNAATPVSQVLTVSKGSQTITFNALAPVAYTTPDFNLGAIATSGLPISYKISDTTVAKMLNGLLHILKPGTVTITASQPGNSNYLAAAKTMNQILTIGKGLQTITFAPLPAAGYGGPAIVASATTSSGLTVTYASSDTTIIKVSGVNLLIKGLGTATITANQAGNANYLSASPVSQLLTVGKGSQTVTFAALAAKTYGAADFALTAAASSKLAVSYASSDTTVAKINGTSVHIVSAGTITITAGQAGNVNYLAAAPVSQTLVINKASQTITFAALAARAYGAADFTLTATAGSKLAITYTSSDTSVAKITGASVHIVAAGTATITASQAGNADYAAAAPVSQLLTVNKAAQTISFTALTAKIYGTADVALTGSANSHLALTYTSSNTAVATIVNGSVHMVGAGTSSITASQAGNSNYAAASSVIQTLTVNKAALNIKANSQTITYGAALPALTVIFTGFVNGETNTVLTTQPTVTTTALASSPAGNYPVTASGAAAANYTITYTAGTLTIGKAAQTITFATLPPMVYGGAAVTPSATASSSLAVTFASSDTTVIKVSGATLQIKGVGTATITASQAGGANYLAATPVSQSITVGKGSQTITFNSLAAKTYGAADFSLSATASSKLAVAYTSSDTTVAKISGNLVHIAGAGTATITANQAGNNYYLAAAPVSQKLTVNQAVQTITFTAFTAKIYGTADFALTGTSNSKLAVSYTSSNHAVATIVNGSVHIVGVGTSSITASQAGNTNYAAATPVTQTLTVNKAALNIKANDQTSTAGSAIPLLTVTYTGLVNGDSNNSLTTQPTVSTTATSASPAGTYPITVKGAAAANYTITYTAGTLTIKAPGSADAIPGSQQEAISVNKSEPGLDLPVEPVVKQAVSPNGDGVNDFLEIENIDNFPDNHLVLMRRDGTRIFEAYHYDNRSHTFDGHNSKNGQMQVAGTYFYLLEYKTGGVMKRKTGYVILKY